jgi:hypothetical protein
MGKLSINICLTILALLVPLKAAAAGCGDVTKIMYIERYAFAPDAHYICSGQSVAIYNRSGRTMYFSYNDNIGAKRSTGLYNGSYTWLSNATPIYDVYYVQNDRRYYITSGTVKLGTAPDSY